MATLKDIARRIKAVKSTQQITKAMKMVASAKLRRAQSRMLEMRPYANKMNDVIKSLAAGVDPEIHPLLHVRPRRTVEIVVLTSDRGLCGAFNTNVIREAKRVKASLEADAPDTAISADGLKVTVCSVGRKARDYYKRYNQELREKWTGLSGNLRFEDAQEITRNVVNNYISGNSDEVYLVYNEFKNAAQQTLRSIKLLPVTVEEAEESAEPRADFIYEPSEEQLLDNILPKNVEVQVYRALLESQASEEAARMTAMENATKAASEMIDRLTLAYNKARQAAITGELMDIVGGVEALKK